MWPGAVLPRAEHLVDIKTPQDALAAGIVLGVRGLEEYAYNADS